MPGVAVVTGAGRGFGREIPRWRGWLARGTAMTDRHALLGVGLLRRQGERKRSRAVGS